MTRRTFLVERLGVGEWFPEPTDETGDFDMDRWRLLGDGTAERGRRPVFAIDVAPDRSTATIAVAWKRPDARVQMQIAAHEDGVGWIVDRAAEVQRRWGGEFILEGTGTAAFLLPELDERRVRTKVVDARWYPEACAIFDQRFTAGTLRHGNHEPMTDAVHAARWHDRGEKAERVLSRKDPKVSPLVAGMIAVRGTGTARGSGGWVVGV